MSPLLHDDPEDHGFAAVTGAQWPQAAPHKLLVAQYGPYEVVLRLGPDNSFLGIEEVRVSRSFLSLEQELASRRACDVDDLYGDEDDAG